MAKVDLAEGTIVDLDLVGDPVDVRALVPPGTDEGLIKVYKILGRRFNSGHSDTAEWHNCDQVDFAVRQARSSLGGKVIDHRVAGLNGGRFPHVLRSGRLVEELARGQQTLDTALA